VKRAERSEHDGTEETGRSERPGGDVEGFIVEIYEIDFTHDFLTRATSIQVADTQAGRAPGAATNKTGKGRRDIKAGFWSMRRGKADAEPHGRPAHGGSQSKSDSDCQLWDEWPHADSAIILPASNAGGFRPLACPTHFSPDIP
jgi:hypothetical protein